MRGKAVALAVAADLSRITPAYAGKRSGFPAVEFYVEDHPRLCGEKQEVRATEIDVKGSPPPMRGKEIVDLSAGCRSRITPAYAGKSQAAIASGFAA